jgi:hypothetical protein
VLAPIVHEKLLDGRAPVCEAASKACMALTQHALAQDSTGRGSSSSGGVDDGAAALVNQLLQLQEQRRAEACSSTAAAQDASALLDVLLWVRAAGAGRCESAGRVHGTAPSALRTVHRLPPA